MMYIDFSAGNKDYKLRLRTRDIVTLEKQIGMNPLRIFGNGDTIPTVNTMVTVLHSSLQSYHHGISLEDTYDIYDNWIADGHAMTDFIAIILEIYKVSGLIKGEPTEKN